MGDIEFGDIPADIGEDNSGFPVDDWDPPLDDSMVIDDAGIDDIVSVQDTDVANFTDSGLTTTTEAADYIDNDIPTEHIEGLDGIEYVDSQEMEDDGVLGMWVYDPSTDTAEIEIYPHDDVGELYDSIAHEIGHNAENHLSDDLIGKWENLYYESSGDYIYSWGDDDRFVTDYATSSADEDFAETYSFYINDPELVQAVCPEKYDFMKNHIFNGEEFV